MPDALAACDLIISRCGAGVLAEITVLGKPSILIPYPYATDNHQEYNARALEKGGAAIVILENELNEDILNEQVKNLINNKDRLEEMSYSSKRLSMPDASKNIVDLVDKLLGITNI
jgi:UDP-N-acetylglucosamine--N-acetylmuramyl-(pentapeptide) pyrophosphoryl-undecaprenol N-acetylglucosamine transferase